jgi:hypothetical protein
MWRTLETAAGILSKTGPWATPAVVTRLLLVAIVVFSVGRLLPGRLNREDFEESNQRARAFQSREGDRRLREWIRSSTAPGAVFLGSYRLSLYVIAPAGGKVVALDPVFANPYVDLATREGDQRTMEDRITENNGGGYCLAASRYGVQYIVREVQQEPAVPPDTFLEEVMTIDGIRVFRAPDCGRGSELPARG